MKNNYSLLILFFVQLSFCVCHLTASVVEKELTQQDKDKLLHNAVLKNDVTLVESALQQGADPNNILDPETGFSVLHQAASNGYYQVVEALLKAGAYVNTQTNIRVPSGDSGNRLTPLHMAAQNNHFWTVKVLVEYGAAINARATIGCKHEETAITLTSSWLIEGYLRWAARKHLQNLIDNGAENYCKNKCLQLPDAYKKELRTVNQERWSEPNGQIAQDNIPEKILAFYDDTKEWFLLDWADPFLFYPHFWSCVMEGRLVPLSSPDHLDMTATNETRICIAHYLLEGTINPINYSKDRLPTNTADPVGRFVANYKLRKLAGKPSLSPRTLSTLAEDTFWTLATNHTFLDLLKFAQRALLPLGICGALWLAYKLYPKISGPQLITLPIGGGKTNVPIGNRTQSFSSQLTVLPAPTA